MSYFTDRPEMVVTLSGTRTLCYLLKDEDLWNDLLTSINLLP
jgi:hypothetical protein